MASLHDLRIHCAIWRQHQFPQGILILVKLTGNGFRSSLLTIFILIFMQTIARAIVIGVMLHGLDHMSCDFIRIANCDYESYNLYLKAYFGSEKPNYGDILGSTVGITGVCMVVLMDIAFILATSWFRRSSVKLPQQNVAFTLLRKPHVKPVHSKIFV